MKGQAFGAILAQAVQAGISFALQILVSRLLGIDDFGRFAILYGMIIVATGVVTGLVGDSLVVLDRHDRAIRGALLGTLGAMSLGLAVVAGVVAWATGFASAVEAVLFACALAAFVIEEIVRRTLMAGMAFHRVVVTDLVGFLVALPIVGAFWFTGGLSLASFFGAIAAGQVVACLAGWFQLPRAERVLVSPWHGAYGAVWGYGTWRGLQQTLRPAMFAVVRLLVLAFVGITAVGLLEAARTYTSPLILVVGGFSSFLFVRFANKRKAGSAGSLREADLSTLVLLGLTVLMGVVAVVLAPWAGPLAFGVQLDPVAIIAWLVYGMSISIVTPYGALTAVAGGQTAVFLIRLIDTLLGLVGVAVMLLLGADASLLPFALAAASFAGGLALRWLATRRPEPPSGPQRTGIPEVQ